MTPDVPRRYTKPVSTKSGEIFSENSFFNLCYILCFQVDFLYGTLQKNSICSL